MTKPTKAQERLVARVRSKGPLVQDNTEDGARFFLAQGGGSASGDGPPLHRRRNAAPHQRRSVP